VRQRRSSGQQTRKEQAETSPGAAVSSPELLVDGVQTMVVPDRQIAASVGDFLLAQEFIDARRQPLVHVREAEQPGAKESGTDHEAGTALQQHGDRSQAFGVQTETDDSVPCEGGNPPEEGQNDETPHVLAAA